MPHKWRKRLMETHLVWWYWNVGKIGAYYDA